MGQFIFVTLENGTVAHIDGNTIIFPQNFEATPGVAYKNLYVKYTSTGVYTYTDGKGAHKDYHVARAYHPDYDLYGNLLSKVAAPTEIVNYISSVRKNAPKNNAFAKALAPLIDKEVVRRDVPNIKILPGTIAVRQMVVRESGNVEVGNIFNASRIDNDEDIVKIHQHHLLMTNHPVICGEKEKGMTIFLQKKDGVAPKINDEVIGVKILHVHAGGKSGVAELITGTTEDLRKYYQERIIKHG